MICGGFVGHASWLSGQAKHLGTKGNIITGVFGGALGWLLLEWLGWYGNEWSLGLKISEIFGYMAMSSVVSGIVLMMATFLRRYF